MKNDRVSRVSFCFSNVLLCDSSLNSSVSKSLDKIVRDDCELQSISINNINCISHSLSMSRKRQSKSNILLDDVTIKRVVKFEERKFRLETKIDSLIDIVRLCNIVNFIR